MAKDLQYYYAQLRRIEEHREKSTEKEIRKVYKTMLTDLQHFISDEYVKLAEDGQLTYEILRGKNEYARFIDEVEKRLNGISPKVSKEIRATVNEMYKLSYDGMVDAVSKSTSSDTLRAAFKGVKGATPETIKAAVENPIAGLTLNDTLEKNRRDIIYNIKKQIGIGLTAGDRMSTMARRIADSLDGDYKKAVRVARTEVHRVRETGHNDCVEEIDQTLQNGTTSLRMVKIWRTMKDERVRPQQRVKTKGGWKTVIRGNADHMKMEGQTVLADELFDLGGGLKAKAPGQSGDASNDINCRCTVEYVLMSDEEYFKATGKHFKPEKAVSATGSEVYGIGDLKEPKRPNRNDYRDADGYVDFDRFDPAREAYKKEKAAYEEKVEEIVQKNLARPQRFKTKDDLAAWANKTGIEITQEARDELDLRMFNDVADVADEMFTKYPFLKKYTIPATPYDEAVTVTFQFGRVPKEDEHSAFMDAIGGVRFNGKFLNYGDAIKEAIYDMESGYTVKGDKTIRTLIRHEMGHNVDAYIRLTKMADVYDGRKLVESGAKKRVQMDDDLIALARKKPDGMSEYAEFNTAEFFAEGFAEYTSGSNTEFAKEFGKLLEKWLR